MQRINTAQIEHHHIFALICGKSGAGKTHALGTLPNDETLILSLESGLLTLKDKNIDVWKIETVEDLSEAYQELKKGTDYKYVCIDSLTELSDMAFASLKPQFKKSQTYALYDEFSTRMTMFIKAFRDLYQYHIFVTTLLKDTEEGYVIDVAQKSLGNRLPAYFDFTFLVKAFEKDGKTTRALVSDNSILDFLKSRSRVVDGYEKVDLTDLCQRIMADNNHGENL